MFWTPDRFFRCIHSFRHLAMLLLFVVVVVVFVVKRCACLPQMWLELHSGPVLYRISVDRVCRGFFSCSDGFFSVFSGFPPYTKTIVNREEWL